MLRVLTGAVALSEVPEGRSCLRCDSSCCLLSGVLRPCPPCRPPPACRRRRLFADPAMFPVELLQGGGSLGRAVWAPREPLLAFIPQASPSGASKDHVGMKEGKHSLRLFLEHLFSPISGPALCQALSASYLPPVIFPWAPFLPLSSFLLPCQDGWAGLNLSESQVHTPGQDISSFPRSPRVPCKSGGVADHTSYLMSQSYSGTGLFPAHKTPLEGTVA